MRYVGNVVEPFVAKCLSARVAIDFAMKKGWKHIALTGDCLSLILKLRNQDSDHLSGGVLIADILHECRRLEEVPFLLFLGGLMRKLID